MEPLSEVHRTSTDFDTQATQGTDGATDGDDRFDIQKQAKNHANKQATDGATLRRPPHEPEKRATERF